MKTVLVSAVLATLAVAVPCMAVTADEVHVDKAYVPHPSIEQIKSSVDQKELKDADAAWKVMTAQGTPYMKRMGVAYQWDKWFKPDVLPKLLAEQHRLERESTSTYMWGMIPMKWRPDPLVPPRAWGVGPKGVGDGYTAYASAKLPEYYPQNWAEESKAPWQWQVQKALQTLLYAVVAGNKDNPKWNDIYYEQVLKLPLKTDEQAIDFMRSTANPIVQNYPKVIARWLKIAENPKFTQAVMWPVFEVDKFQDLDLQNAMIVELLCKCPHKSYRGQLGLWSASLAKRVRLKESRPDWIPATAVLTLCRYAVDPESGTDWERLYSCAFEVCDTVKNPPFVPDWWMDPESPRVQAMLERFEEWFKASEPELVKLSAQEKPLLESKMAPIRKAIR